MIINKIHWLGVGLSSPPGILYLKDEGYELLVWNRSVDKAQSLLENKVNINYLDFLNLSNQLDENDLIKLMELGVNCIGISLDGSTEEVFENIKGKKTKSPYSWNNHLNVINTALKIFGKGHVTTHLIVGLGETDREILRTIQELHNCGVFCSLFAFTPLKGTKLEEEKKPKIERYRALQLARYLIINNKILFDELIFDKYEKLLKITTKIEFLSEMFQTSGCPNCNRPFYNENVRGPIYNYPDKINNDDLKEIKNQLKEYKVI